MTENSDYSEAIGNVYTNFISINIIKEYYHHVELCESKIYFLSMTLQILQLQTATKLRNKTSSNVETVNVCTEITSAIMLIVVVMIQMKHIVVSNTCYSFQINFCRWQNGFDIRRNSGNIFIDLQKVRMHNIAMTKIWIVQEKLPKNDAQGFVVE